MRKDVAPAGGADKAEAQRGRALAAARPPAPVRSVRRLEALDRLAQSGDDLFLMLGRKLLISLDPRDRALQPLGAGGRARLAGRADDDLGRLLAVLALLGDLVRIARAGGAAVGEGDGEDVRIAAFALAVMVDEDEPLDMLDLAALGVVGGGGAGRGEAGGPSGGAERRGDVDGLHG